MTNAPIRRIRGYSPYEDPIGFSRAVVLPAGARLVLVAGLTSARRDGSGIARPGDAHGQARAALETAAAVLADAGTDLAHVVRTRMYVVGAQHCDEVGRAHHEVFAEVRPVASMLLVAGLIDPAMLVEIEVEAVLPG